MDSARKGLDYAFRYRRVDDSYNQPRGPGHQLLTLLAGYELTREKKYLDRCRPIVEAAKRLQDQYAGAFTPSRGARFQFGIALEGLKITSHSEFMRMVEEYAGLDDEEEINALEAVWVAEYGTVSPNMGGPFEEDLLSAGLEVHEGNCLDCHASAKWAFTSFTVAKIIKPVALWLDQVNGISILWYIHIISCFAGLAYLPFSKMFHIFTVPLSLIMGQVMDQENKVTGE